MSHPAAHLPSWLAPREQSPGSRRLWRIETLVLVIVGLFLTVAAVNDLVLTVHQDSRLVADQVTWRHFTHRDYHIVSAAPLVLGRPTDVSCANSTPGPPGERSQICILIRGPIHDSLRTVTGGFRLAASTGDLPRNRYDCWGAAAVQHLCAKR